MIGYDAVGMGHIYRSLTLAHEMAGHEIVFACDKKSALAVSHIAGHDYEVEVYEEKNIADKIITLGPALVINDMLNTSMEYILKLKAHGISVVSFEDMGSGAKHTDLTINELFDESRAEGKNIRWGHKYLFLRDEFLYARPHKFKKTVDALLITFGGTDPNNLTAKTLSAVVDFCRDKNIRIYVVTGPGYLYKEALKEYIGRASYKNIEFTSAAGVISKIMEKTQIAISSNGRTVYELYHMNIPSLVISHHERENTHLFSQPRNGFMNLGTYENGATEQRLALGLKKLAGDENYRRKLFNNMKRLEFSKNKKKVMGMLLRLLRESKRKPVTA